MQLLGDDIDGNAVLVVEVGQRHQDHPLRAADAERLGPEVAQLFEVYADGIDHPGEPPDAVLILLSRLWHRHPLRVWPAPTTSIVDADSLSNLLWFHL